MDSSPSSFAWREVPDPGDTWGYSGSTTTRGRDISKRFPASSSRPGLNSFSSQLVARMSGRTQEASGLGKELLGTSTWRVGSRDGLLLLLVCKVGHPPVVLSFSEDLGSKVETTTTTKSG